MVERVSSQCDKFFANCTPFPDGWLYNAALQWMCVCVCVCWSLMMGRHKRWSERKTRQENRDMRRVDKKGERQRRWERWGSETQLHSFGDAHILVHISPCDQSTQKTSNCHSHTRFHRSDSFWFTLNKQWKQILSKGTIIMQIYEMTGATDTQRKMEKLLICNFLQSILMIQCFIGSNETYRTIVDISIISLFLQYDSYRNQYKMYFAFIACQFITTTIIFELIYTLTN